MAGQAPTKQQRPGGPSPAQSVRELTRTAFKGALATLEAGTGHPYASLVTVGMDAAGAPVLLLSNLAMHTRNLKDDARASVLIDGTSDLGDPLAGGRVTLVGSVKADDDPAIRDRFLARHPAAADYAGFSDFAFYRMDVTKAHFIGGFGRIVTLPASEIIEDVSDSPALLAAEAEIRAHMNSDHADALELYATRLGGRTSRGWKLITLDPAGFDLVRGSEALRLAAPERMRTPGEARRVLKLMAGAARSRG